MRFRDQAERALADQKAYATLRVSLRQAILRISGIHVGDVSTIFRDIETGAKVGPVTDALEHLLREVCEEQAEGKWHVL